MFTRASFSRPPACQFGEDSSRAKASFCLEPAHAYRLRDRTRQIRWLCDGHAAQYRAQGAQPVRDTDQPACDHRMRDGSLCGAPAARVRLLSVHVRVAGQLCSIHRAEMAASGFRVEVPGRV